MLSTKKLKVSGDSLNADCWVPPQDIFLGSKIQIVEPVKPIKNNKNNSKSYLGNII